LRRQDQNVKLGIRVKQREAAELSGRVLLLERPYFERPLGQEDVGDAPAGWSSLRLAALQNIDQPDILLPAFHKIG
jgi:hypothetical protein